MKRFVIVGKTLPRPVAEGEHIWGDKNPVRCACGEIRRLVYDRQEDEYIYDCPSQFPASEIEGRGGPVPRGH